MATETASVLFTDLVGSTELRARLGEDAADALQRAHDALLAAAVEASGGRVVKNLGDGIMATFTSAADAVGAAVAMQHAAWEHRRTRPTEQVELRVGISVGDVSFEGDDCFGTPVVEASRLCAAALGGQIIAADLVRAMARGRGGHRFEPLGDLELKGLPEPLAAAQVLWDPPARDSGAAGRPGYPPLLVGNGTVAYVGREALLGRLDAAWHEVRQGGCRTVLLAGEPGVGKTHTSAEIARAAYDDGATVLYGRCDEAWGVPHQPFVEAVDHFTAGSGATGATLGRLPGELARLLPDLAARVGGLAPPVASDPKTEEHRLFEAVTSWLVDASREGGLVLVVDDLHWAAKPTLQLLLHVVRAAAAPGSGARLLVVATYRDTDIDRTHPLSSTLADLRRLSGVERISVDGLTGDEVVAFVETAAGHALDVDTLALARRVHAETEGNPFFVGEVLRHLVETGVVRRTEDRWVVVDVESVAVPEGVRDVVGRRVSQLSETANTVLSMASVVGRDFTLDVVGPLVDGGDDAVLDALDEALRARLVEETGPDAFRFAHALVRTTLYDELSASRRRRLHRRVADVLEKLHADDVVALAHHTVEGGPDGGDLRRAVTYTLAAADQALHARAIADAERRFHQAVELIDDWDDPDPVLRLRAMCGLGEAQRDQGDPAHRETLLQAAAGAAEIGATDLLVRAVLANSRGVSSIIGKVDRERVDALERALAALPDAPSAERAMVMATLAAELSFDVASAGRRVELVDAAWALAQTIGDDRLEAEAAVRLSMLSWRPATWTQAIGWAQTSVDLADRTNDPNLRVLARFQLAMAHSHAADIAAAEAAAAEGLAIAEREGTPVLVWMMQAVSAQFPAYVGDFAEAHARNDAAAASGNALGMVDAQSWWGAVMGGIAYSTGSWTEIVDVMAPFADAFSDSPVWPIGVAATYAEAGRFEEASAMLAKVDFDALFDGPGETFTVSAWANLATYAWAAADAGLAQRIADAVTRHGLQDHWAGFGMYLQTPLRYPLLVADALAGRIDEALAHARRADQQIVAAGLHVHRLRLLDIWVDVLRERGTADDLVEADRLCREGHAAAVRFGLDHWIRRFGRARQSGQRVDPDHGPSGRYS